jgi:copper chaperone CopZ
METGSFVIKNMASQEDANKVLKAIENVWGYTRGDVNLSTSKAVFTYDERMASVHDFEQAIKDTGFEI